MKKILTILAFTILPLISIGQEANVDIKNNDTAEIIIEKKAETQNAKQTSSNSTAKSQLLKINRKKSSDIISIKAYRKSLQIKVKEVKLC
ncbi:hypothetical protein SAMN04515667_0237 [Formosa sp. Hel1_31_208]|uniref:hypothetical protein n=1 Tax=Formosa sp. Hel1_31_208 TaxID=1798225 RepID=UPI00087D5C06|nr:hypothetical protein [Formosa sp. Hel1_31_208]SDR67776.1 hypothetical protein SAMN04515667_0237 [Formosa sp. Hel1_31_208]